MRLLLQVQMLLPLLQTQALLFLIFIKGGIKNPVLFC